MKKKLLIIVPVLVGLMLGAFIYHSSAVNKLKVGEMAPDINMASPEGVNIELKSLRGKYVLVDFWASWCGPCRKENQSLVRAYNKYKDRIFTGSQGFTIYSVSLDTDIEIWKKAIRNDQLVWASHVSDFKKWECKSAAEYGVTALPTSFLLDPSGKIIATDLEGTALEAELERLVKK